MTWWLTIGLFLVVAAFAYAVQEIWTRVKLVNIRLNRLSHTFDKIEIDLEAIHNSLVVLAKDDLSKQDAIKQLRDRRNDIAQVAVLGGFEAEKMLRGLEGPHPSDDPTFWKQMDNVFPSNLLPDEDQ